MSRATALGAALTVGLLALLAGGWFASQRGFLGEPTLPGRLGALQRHLASAGIDTHARQVHPGSWEGVRAMAGYTPHEDRSRVFHVMECSSPELAQRHLLRLRRAPSPCLPEANGTLVIYLTHWPADDALTRRVLDAFRRFPAARGVSRAGPPRRDERASAP